MAGSFTKRLVRGGKTETCAITVSRPKSAALCFDKIYTSNDHDVPQEIRPVYARAGDLAITGGTAAKILDLRPNHAALREDLAHGSVELCKGLKSEGLRPVRYYNKLAFGDKAYSPGDGGFIGISIRNLEVVSEDDLNWSTVMAFREDPRSRGGVSSISPLV